MFNHLMTLIIACFTFADGFNWILSALKTSEETYSCHRNNFQINFIIKELKKIFDGKLYVIFSYHLTSE